MVDQVISLRILHSLCGNDKVCWDGVGERLSDALRLVHSWYSLVEISEDTDRLVTFQIPAYHSGKPVAV